MVKANPVPFAVGGVVLLLVIMSSRSGSSSSAAGYSTASMQQSTALAQINAGTSVSLGAQATERYKAGEAAALERTSIAASLLNSMTTTNANTAVAMSGINATQVKNAMDAQNTRASIDANASNQRYQMEETAKLGWANINAQVAMHTDDNNFKLKEIGATTQGQLELMDKAGVISTNQLGMNLDWQGKYLPTVLQSQENIMRIQGANQLAIVKEQMGPEYKRAQAEKNKSDWGIVGSIGKSIGSVFGF
jgi:hypothetical protein